MGLDIYYYERLRPVDESEYDEDCDRMAWWSKHESFPEQRDGIESPFVEGWGDQGRFRAGSYSGYNAWRAWLSNLVHGVEPKVLWEDESYKGKDFYELINFTDCDGVIGPKTAAKLAGDFAQWQAKVDELGDKDDVWLYRQFRHAFETAAFGGGFVEFA